MFGTADLTDALVEAAANGSKSDQARLARAVRTHVRAMVVARLSPFPDRLGAVDDLVQEALSALDASVCRLKTRTVAGLRAFMTGIVSNKVAAYVSRNADGQNHVKEPVALDATARDLFQARCLWEFLAPPGASPETADTDAETVELIIKELGTLEDEARDVITLALFDQLPTAEIAGRMGLSRQAVAMLLIRAVGTLRRNVAESSGEQG